MKKVYIRELIRNNDPFSVMIHEFNVWPTRYAHISWYDGIGDYGQLRSLMQSERVEKKVAAMILEKIDNEFFYKFTKTTQAIGLLDRPAIERLIWYSGLAVNCKLIRRSPENQGETGNPVRQAIGENAFHFAVHQAPLLIGSMDFDFSNKTIGWGFDDEIMTCGQRLLELALSDHSSAIKSRVKLKFPKAFKWNFPDAGEETQVLNAQVLVRKLMQQEIMPLWKGLLS